MREVNLRSIDLNLLVVLKALLDERHITRAASKAGLSQPAMSRALARLRKTFNDPLLVRTSSGLCLTSRASDLQAAVHNILSDIQNIICAPSSNPREMRGEITIGARDYEVATVLPKVIQQITEQAPGLKLNIISLTGDNLDPLERNEVDFILSATESQSATLCRKLLFKDDFICMVSKKNSLADKTLTLDDFLQLNHCMTTISGFGPGLVDLELAKLGLQRNVVVRTSQFLCVSHLIAHSDLIVTLPRKMGELLSQQGHTSLCEVPISMEPFPIFLYWHIKHQTNPIHQWLRQSVFFNI